MQKDIKQKNNHTKFQMTKGSSPTDGGFYIMKMKIELLKFTPKIELF
jgi:hypothetical protein